MKKYRLGYDFLFLPKDSFSYKNELIGSMSIYVLFKVLKDGKEILFESDELKDQKLYFNGQSCYLQDAIICSFDRNKILHFEPNTSLINKFKNNLQIEWEIDSYSKDIDEGVLEPKIITESEFMDIMKNNIETFDNSDNHSAQSVSYFTQEIETTSSKR